MNKVLVVDDVHDLAESLTLLMTLTGHPACTAYNGLEAVAAARRERPDIVILDLNMPVMDGFQAARQIRDLYPTPPPVLIAVSALSINSVQQRLDDCGFDHFLGKPTDIDALLALVDKPRP
jgi:CheY-like chemotaxis protein